MLTETGERADGPATDFQILVFDRHRPGGKMARLRVAGKLLGCLAADQTFLDLS